jgi:uncharacterized protein YjbJ (UPF0337 family)
MNADVFAGKWKQMKGSVKQWWGKLTDDDIARVEGSRDKLVGLLQERYGYAKDKAEAEIDRRFRDAAESASPGPGRGAAAPRTLLEDTPMLVTILLVILVLLVIGALPSWPYSSGWGYGPSGIVGLILIIIVILALTGRL